MPVKKVIDVKRTNIQLNVNVNKSQQIRKDQFSGTGDIVKSKSKHVYVVQDGLDKFYNSTDVHITHNIEHINRLTTVRYNVEDEKWMCNTVRQDGRINAIGCRIQVKSNWNLQLVDSLCQCDEDKRVATFLRYGWPTNRDNSPLPITCQNHDSATHFTEQVREYLCKEIRYGTLMGPYATPPFDSRYTAVSPLSTRAKKQSMKRRIIMDLSWPPEGPSVNSGIPKDTYLGVPHKVRFPTSDDICRRAMSLSNNGTIPIFGWRKDMERAFKQVPLDPSCYSEMGMFFLGAYLFDKMAVMGCRSAPMACQDTTSFISRVMKYIDYVVYNYVDDFMSVDQEQMAWRSYVTMGNLLRDLGVTEAEEKSVAPTQKIEFLGIWYDFITMKIYLPQDKLREIKEQLDRWVRWATTNKKQLQQLAGKLQFAAVCIRPGRVLLNRIYDAIANMDESVRYNIDIELRKDIIWWRIFMKDYNGRSIMWLPLQTKMNEMLATDACLQGAGGICENSYFHTRFPESLEVGKKYHIAHLEMIAIVVALKIWKDKLSKQKFLIGCDNQNVVAILTTGRTRNKLLQAILREITFLLAKMGSELCIHYIKSENNVIPDLLSRWYNGESYIKEFYRRKKASWQEININDELFKISHNW